MASSVETVYLWGDEFDLVMRLLNEDEDFNADIDRVVEEVDNVLIVVLFLFVDSYMTFGDSTKLAS